MAYLFNLIMAFLETQILNVKKFKFTTFITIHTFDDINSSLPRGHKDFSIMSSLSFNYLAFAFKLKSILMCGFKRRPILLSPLWITYLQVNRLVYHSYTQILTETLYYWVRDKGYFTVAVIKVARRSPFLCMSPSSQKMMGKEQGCLRTQWLCYKKRTSS